MATSVQQTGLYALTQAYILAKDKMPIFMLIVGMLLEKLMMECWTVVEVLWLPYFKWK